ncbi:MAG: histidine phosphatase family protein [bacterium]|nr:histidine phosphatase family protein [bacterium]
MKQVKFVLCRHTEVDLNAQHRYTGQIDVPLNAVGKLQAKRLADQLSKFTISAVFSSDLIRAVETASEITALHPHIAPRTDPRLREVNLGQLNGMLKSEVEKLYQNAIFSTQHANFDFSAVGGESREQVIRRHIEFFDEVTNTLENDSGNPPFSVVVGHGTALRIFLRHLGIKSLLEQGNYQIITYPN